MAIHDGVDVLSVSLGGDPVPLHKNGVAIGSFHAVMNGIVVVCSAGNSGPNSSTVGNVAPWQFTVGASTMDRLFPSYVMLGNNMRLRVINRYLKRNIQFKLIHRDLLIRFVLFSYPQGGSLSDTWLQEKKSFSLISARNAKAANATAEEA
ncbi:subtilisin-like protease sbt5.3 [Phtheirospermum japonicum]|uniref:Subtilisin-like protease sbt5.3 n=1 Tax=Phtheirospermum japonicum TaxID=374723 RepID=A0A830D7U0_9LAMI|nr:subtilisin-like protease sbt5.3 [Phtheirospermum japonicum]